LFFKKQIRTRTDLPFVISSLVLIVFYAKRLFDLNAFNVKNRSVSLEMISFPHFVSVIDPVYSWLISSAERCFIASFLSEIRACPVYTYQQCVFTSPSPPKCFHLVEGIYWVKGLVNSQILRVIPAVA